MPAEQVHLVRLSRHHHHQGWRVCKLNGAPDARQRFRRSRSATRACKRNGYIAWPKPSGMANCPVVRQS